MNSKRQDTLFLQTVALLLLSVINTASGQAYKPHPLLSPMWQADAEYYVPSQVEDTTLKHGYTGGGFTFRMPIYTGKDWLSAEGGHPFYAVLAQAKLLARQTQVDYLEPDRLLTVSSFSITGLMATGPSSLRNLYLLQGTVSMPTEDFKLEMGHQSLHGALIWRHLYHNNKFWHTLGIIYSPVLGRDLILPVIGGGYKMGNDDYVQLTLPFNFAYTHLFSRKFSMSVKLNSQGGYNHIHADSTINDGSVLFRNRFSKVSLLARYYTDRNVVLVPEIGVTGKGRLAINDQKDTQLSSFYFKFSLQVRFGKRPAASPILNFDPGDSGFDPSYLVE